MPKNKEEMGLQVRVRILSQESLMHVSFSRVVFLKVAPCACFLPHVFRSNATIFWLNGILGRKGRDGARELCFFFLPCI